MKRNLLFVLTFILASALFSQQNVFKTQGIPRPELGMDSKVQAQNFAKGYRNSGMEIPDYSFDNIKFWVGTGSNKAALIIDWYHDNSETLVWGYRWDGEAYGVDMVRAIAAEDPRFAASMQDWGWSWTVSGFGYDANNNGNMCATDGSSIVCKDNLGIMSTTGDGFYSTETDDYWRSGWADGYWSYQLKNPGETEYEYSGSGFSDRLLTNECWDVWAYQEGWESWEGVIPREPFTPVLPMVLDQEAVNMEEGEYLQLTATIYQKSYQDKKITWTSSDNTIATVNENGKVKALKEGTVTITATAGKDCFASSEITINAGSSALTFKKIDYWVGNGSKQAAIIIKWNDGKTDDALVWGYRWDGDITILDALKEIAKTDARLFLLLSESENIRIGGIAFDLNGKNTQSLIYNGDMAYPLYPVNGFITATSKNDNFDLFENSDAEDHWASGLTIKGIWNFLHKEDVEDTFKKSTEDIAETMLSDGSWNAWNFDKEFANPELGNEFLPVSEYIKRVVDYTKGIFIVNEDWFGHTNGSVNFLTEEGEWIYHAYTRENPGESFGSTTTFGTIYGENFYFVSKQPIDGGNEQYLPGGRLVIADAKTLKKKATFKDVGGGDGRSFLGVDEKTGYIGTSSGITLFDIATLTVGKKITGSNEGVLYDGQIGTMIRVGNYVFACLQNSGVIVIDAIKHEVIKTIDCPNIGTIVLSKDGSLWASAYKDGLWRINPYTFEIVEKREIPQEAWIPSSWGAWASSFVCASEKTNTLFWAKLNGNSLPFFGTKVFKYDIDNPDLSKPFYELTREKEAFYGSAINIEPITENLIITTTQSGYGLNYQYNWVHIVNSETGDPVKIESLDTYYWFQSMSVFPDNYDPEISATLINFDVHEKTKLSLYEKVTDKDNKNAAIIKQVEVIEGSDFLRAYVESDSLVLQPLAKNSAKIRLTANSNGKIATKEMDVNISDFISVESVDLDKKQIEVDAYDIFRLTATVYPENASNKTVLWSSSDESIATVDKNGLVTTLKPGEITITVTTEDGQKAVACNTSIKNVPVTGMVLDTESARLDAYFGKTLQLVPIFTPDNATNKNITWNSSNPEIASVNENGLVKALEEGEAIITAVTEDGNIEAVCNITTYITVFTVNLNSFNESLKVGSTFQLTATIKPENATNKNIKSWVSSNPEVASVDENGLVTALKKGFAVVTATSEEDNRQGMCVFNCEEVTVSEISINQLDTNNLPVGEELQLEVVFLPENATNKNIQSWTSNHPEIASVDENGLVKALANGEVTITATTQDGEKTASAIINCITPVKSISLNYESKEMSPSEQLRLEATVLPEDATNKNIKSWISSHPEVASVNENGLVTAIEEGTATITVTTEDGDFEAYCEISIILTGIGKEAVVSTLVYPTITKGEIFVEQHNRKEIVIADMQGLIFDKITPQENKVTIDMSTYSEGIYFIIIGNKSYKIIKR